MPVNAEPGVRPQVIKGAELQQVAIRHAAGETNAASGLPKRHQEVVNSAQQVAAEKNPRDSLGLLVTRLSETPANVGTLAEQLIRTPDATSAQITVQDAKVNKINNIYSGLQEILMGNSPANRVEIATMFMNAIGPNDAIRILYDPTGGSPNIDKIEKFLRSKAGERLASNLNEIMRQAREKASPLVLKNNEDVRNNLLEIMKAESVLNTTRAHLDALTNAQQNINNFNGRDQAVLDLQVSQLAASTNPDIHTFSTALDQRARLITLQSSRSLTPVEADNLGRIVAQIDRAKMDGTFGTRCLQIENLYNRKQYLIQTAAEAAKPGAIKKAETEFQLAEKTHANLQAKNAELVAARDAITFEFESQIKNVVGETAIETFKADVAEYMTNHPKYEKEALDALEKSGREALDTYMESRYHKTKEAGHLWFKKTVLDFDRDKIDKDWTELSSGNPPNPDKLIQRWMNEAEPKLTAEQKTAMLTNPDTMKALRADMTVKLFLASTQTGRIPPESQMRIILNTSWGEEAMDKAFAKNESVNRKLEQYIGKGYVAKDVLRHFGPMKFLLILLASLGLIKDTGVPLQEN